MHDLFLFAVLGLGAGSGYGIIASGITLIYRGSGVVNFAQGALAMIAALQYAQFVGDGMPAPLALVATLGLAAVLGLAIQVGVMRLLRDAPIMARLVATFGIILLLQAVAALRFGTANNVAESVLPTDRITVWGVSFGVDRLYLAGITLSLAGALWAMARYTRFGSLVQAVADSEKGVALLGYSPDFLSGATWVLGSVLAALGGILIVSITGTDSLALTLLVIPALAAALLARFSNFLLVAVAGLGIGVAQSLLTKYQGTYAIPDGARDAAPFLVIIVAMVVRGRLIPDRGVLREGRPPTALSGRAPWPVVAGGLVVTVTVLWLVSATYQAALITSMIGVIIALSLVVITGWVGQISLAQLAFAGLGALFASKLASSAGLPFELVVPLAALLTVPVGVLIGLPALRVRGVNLAIVTLGGAVAVSSVVFKNASVTGGLDGSRLPKPSVFGLDVNAFDHPFRYGVTVLVVMTACLAGASWLRRGRIGLRMLAVRDNERAACAEGISLARTKLLAFAVSSFLAGVAGALYGYQQGVVAFERFDPLTSILIVGLVYIAGVGALSGSLLAGVTGAGGVLVVLLAQVNKIDEYQNLLAGVGVLLVAIHRPDGIMPALAARLAPASRRFRRRRSAGPGPVTAAPVPTGTARTGTACARAGSATAGEALLSTDGLSVRYGNVVALHDVSIDVRAGHLVGLIGPNGAGKSTFIDAVTGFTPSSGGVSFAGRRLDRVAAHERARLGLRRTFQTIELFEDLTVEENLLLGRRGGVDAGSALMLSPEQALEVVGLGDVRRRLPPELSNGERKLVGVARALAGHARFVLLDEPAAGLDSAESAALGRRLREIVDAGVAVLLIDHDIDLIMENSDVVYVLDQGCLIASGEPGEVRDDPAVRAAYIGDAPAEGQLLSAMPVEF